MADNQKTIKKIQEIIKNQFIHENREVGLDEDVLKYYKGDSLDQVELIMAIEEVFEVDISDADAEKITTTNQMVEYLNNV